MCGDVAAVRFDQTFCDREAKAEPGTRADRQSFGLSKAVKNVR